MRLGSRDDGQEVLKIAKGGEGELAFFRSAKSGEGRRKRRKRRKRRETGGILEKRRKTETFLKDEAIGEKNKSRWPFLFLAKKSSTR
jgi:hypothetical protein